MKPLVAVALSGGIDSLFAAYILKEQGYKIVGIHFINGYESFSLPRKHRFHIYNDTDDVLNKKRLSNAENIVSYKITSIEKQLGIVVKVIESTIAFKKNVVDYFIQTYKSGKTPNPCLICNQSIKFGTVLDFALELGASCLATGHYARVIKDSKGIFHLLRGSDPYKDQSYFLALLSQKQLSMVCFPLGGMTKQLAAKIAADKGLAPVLHGESQDICFINGKTYSEFLLQQPGFESKPGPILDVSGNTVGRHKGLHLFTIGQRRGINCPGPEPYYVVSMDRNLNRLIVGSKKDLLADECTVVQINWINQQPASPLEVFTRVRYRHKAVESTLFPISRYTAVIRFKVPQSAVTPGQGAVFYLGDEVIGGGWIDCVKS